MDKTTFRVHVTFLYSGTNHELFDAPPEEAVRFIQEHETETNDELKLRQIELVVKTVGDPTRVEGIFFEKNKAIHFIENIHRAL